MKPTIIDKSSLLVNQNRLKINPNILMNIEKITVNDIQKVKEVRELHLGSSNKKIQPNQL